MPHFNDLPSFRDRKGTPKNFSDKDIAELSGELSGAVCLKTLVLLGGALELFRKFFGAVRAILWLWGSSLALESCMRRLLPQYDDTSSLWPCRMHVAKHPDQLACNWIGAGHKGTGERAWDRRCRHVSELCRNTICPQIITINFFFEIMLSDNPKNYRN